ncbi:hypothetical protein GCK72_018537 [Caenorhabditis remanei]|uniref:Uncharacterized protein n=1 Tax=Caenorhabditis remanei TaxID=31234 RepID=A0A6A5GBD6_CAERE|nr:hypothetical protein GCK72_018537 [Caenorhabditis remanei]KAF1751983.1 hypothetical protein GCK72_018537 [Caenorhabditis remanei]
MADDGGDVGEQLLRNSKSRFLSRLPIWAQFDSWIDEIPTKRRAEFEVVKSAMLVHCDYPAIVINRIGSESGVHSPENATQQFTNFVNTVHQTKLFKHQGTGLPAANLFALLADIFSSIPEYESETGVIRQNLKMHLKLMLDEENEWETMFFNTNFVRSVYWQLLFTLRLIPFEADNQPEEMIEDDENRPKLMFASFVVAVLVGVLHGREDKLSPKIPIDATQVAQHFVTLISSPHFRTLSQFFLVGLWCLIQYKVGGGTVTVDDETRLTASEMRERSRKYLLRHPDPKLVLDSRRKIGDDTMTEEMQLEWESNTILLHGQGKLKSPDGFRIVKKGGRPRKYPISQNRKRRQEEALVNDEIEQQRKKQEQQRLQQLQQLQRMEQKKQQQQQPQRKSLNRFQKKSTRGSPRKQIRDARQGKVDQGQDPAPSTSAAIPSKPVHPKKVVPTAEEVGLCTPLYVVQADFLKHFEEECARRREGYHREEEKGRAEKIVFESLSEIHHVARQTFKTKPRPLNADQKLVMEKFKKDWRRGNVPEDAQFEEEEEDVHGDEEYEDVPAPEVVTQKVAKSGGKAPKRWKRRY